MLVLGERLWDAGRRVLGVHPNQVAAARDRFRVSGGKSDRFDAFVLYELEETGTSTATARSLASGAPRSAAVTTCNLLARNPPDARGQEFRGESLGGVSARSAKSDSISPRDEQLLVAPHPSSGGMPSCAKRRLARRRPTRVRKGCRECSNSPNISSS